MMTYLSSITYVLLFVICDTARSTTTKCIDVCYRISYNDLLSRSRYPRNTCSVTNGNAGKDGARKLKANFKEWTFSKFPLLLLFPIDRNEENHIREVRDALFSKVYPTPFKSKSKLAAYSKDVLVDVLDMDPHIVNTDHFLLIASGSGVLRGQMPLAHRYGGHQFGVWAGQLGDGRAHILGEYVNDAGNRYELQLKGSGTTPYSRAGDGRAVIRSSVREFLCSEAMHYLGIPSSRAASLIVNDDQIWRDKFYNGNFQQERTAVVLRLAKSWFRFGSFEILSHYGELRLLQQLTDFVIKHYFSHIPTEHPDRYMMFFEDVVEQTALLIARWQSVGFSHGVCNTDNFSILSLTIDYGPFGFMEQYDPKMVPNTSDDEKRYSYEKQPEVGFYNLDKLRQALLPIIPMQNQFMLTPILNRYGDIYKKHFVQLFRMKLGLVNIQQTDEHLVALLLKIMSDTKSDFTMTFRHLGEWNLQLDDPEYKHNKLWTLQLLASHEHFEQWTELYKQRSSFSNISETTRMQLMNQNNPRYILRNWIAEDIIRRVENNDFDLLQGTLEILKHPYQEQEAAESLGYASEPPTWAKTLKVSCSS